MIDTSWALRVLPDILVIRLRVISGGWFRAAVICDATGRYKSPLYGYLAFGVKRSSPRLTLSHSREIMEWTECLRNWTRKWDDSWSRTVPEIYQFSGGVNAIRNVSPSNVLVLQHLARLEGMIWQYSPESEAEETIIQLINHRLAAVISQANRERQVKIAELTPMLQDML